MTTAPKKKQATKPMQQLTMDRPSTIKAEAMSERTVRLNVTIDPVLHKKLRQKALDSDVSIRELVVTWLAEKLAE